MRRLCLKKDEDDTSIRRYVEDRQSEVKEEGDLDGEIEPCWFGFLRRINKGGFLQKPLKTTSKLTFSSSVLNRTHS